MQIKKPFIAVVGAAIVGVVGPAALPAIATAAPLPTAAVATNTVPSPSTASTSTASGRYGVWPAQVRGVPAHLAGGDATGFYLWHSSDGWRLEVTHPGSGHDVFTGTIRSDGTLAYKRVGDERGDIIRLGSERHSLGFAFSNYGHLDGMHFVTDRATRLTFDLAIDGRPAGVARVDIGAKSLHPDRVPFTVSRTGIR